MPGSPKPFSPSEQLAMLKDAAVLASQGKFRCADCKQVFDRKAGITILARGNVLLGLDMDCAKQAEILLRPQPDGSVNIHIRPNGRAQSTNVIQAASLDDVRAVELSKLSIQTAEKIDYADAGEK